MIKTLLLRLTGFTYAIVLVSVTLSAAQTLSDSSHWSLHFQQTVIPQGKLHSRSLYTGPNSMTSAAQVAVSLTSTMFFHVNLWKGAEFEFDPEMAGGRGIGQVLGLAGFTNGECFRIGNPEPRLYLARMYLRQTFSLPGDGLGGRSRTLAITAGKFSVADYFDNNRYSHDPRSQFMNWSLMSNGGWDYPANTRGYTAGLVAQLTEGDWVLRLSHAAVPTTANGPTLNRNIGSNYSTTAELQRTFHTFNYPGVVRLLGFYTKTRMGSYAEAIEHETTPDIADVRRPGHTKYGYGVNLEQPISESAGLFLRGSWNDGHNETWAFTEIDHSISGGYSTDGRKWNRPNDRFGAAAAMNGLSVWHREYLAAGGLGFMLGDGQLTYRPEMIVELYYSTKVNNFLTITPNIQYVRNPGFNADQGPLWTFALRLHTEF